MHIPPEVWGPIFWATIHITALGYPDQPSYSEKKAAKEYFNALPYLLPCPVCRDHFREVLQGIPIEPWLDNRKSLIEWTVMAHNKVNERLEKPQLTMAEFYEHYNEMAKRGLPIPPASPTAEISDAMLNAAYIRGGTHIAAGIFAAAAIGGLLWVSYRR
jgi:hypothetical protein